MGHHDLFISNRITFVYHTRDEKPAWSTYFSNSKAYIISLYYIFFLLIYTLDEDERASNYLHLISPRSADENVGRETRRWCGRERNRNEFWKARWIVFYDSSETYT